MLRYTGGNQNAVIVLHEIYGVNAFIKERCRQYHAEGYDVFCPELYRTHTVFPYAQTEEAHRTFLHAVGFDAYREVDTLAAELRRSYRKVLLIGFSVGATLAWRCSESPLYDGVLCCYGSRIRDYLSVSPRCPVLLIFAEQDSFDVAGTVTRLCGKTNTTVATIAGRHGFADRHSGHYSGPAAERLEALRKQFLHACTG